VGLGINPALAKRIRDADLLLAFGPRLGEATTNGYTLLDIPKTKQTLVHVHQGAEELGRVYSADLPIVSGMPELASLLAALQPPSERWHGPEAPTRHIAPISTGASRARSRATCRWAK
jgi:acetolactate synthase-1/2/3 large subunit